MNNNNWTNEVVDILERIRKNSITLSNRHRKNFYEYKSYSKYFDLPTIVFSTLSASFSVGAGKFLKQELVSVATCGVSMVVAILTSIKLYLQLEENIKIELEMSKSFHTLSLELYKTLNLDNSQRNFDGLEYLNKKMSEYIKMIEQSNLLRRNLKKDFLLEIESELISEDEPSSFRRNISSFEFETKEEQI